MEEKIKFDKPSELVLLDTVKAINALDAVRMGVGAEDYEMMSLCCPYLPVLADAFNKLIELAAISLGFRGISDNGIKKYVKGSLLEKDFFEINFGEFAAMIYSCRFDTVMLHNIYECFVSHNADAVAAVAENFTFSL